MNVRVTAAAEADLAAAPEWCRARPRGLPLRFLSAFDSVTETIAKHPEFDPAVEGEVRRVLLRGFPHAVLYVVRRRSLGGGSVMRALIRLAAVLFFATAFNSIALAGSTSSSVVDSKFEFFVHDAAESKRFYAALGFSVAHAKPDGYSTLTHGSTVIALSPLPWWLPAHWLGFLRHPPLGTEVVLYTTHLEALKSALEEHGYSPARSGSSPGATAISESRTPTATTSESREGTAVPGQD